tara:strand:- start:1806 stop:2444 length:639 start_codon:yes stop_codon:yes gene_type:complete
VPEIKIIPSLIAETQEELDERINHIKDAAKWLQMDIMDKKFVPSSSIEFDFVLPNGVCKFEAHLMLEDPVTWINKHAHKVDTILVHIESCEDPEAIIEMVKGKGKKMGFALRPETLVSTVEEYLDKIEEVLFMTVEPGFYGAKFLPETLDKVKELRAIDSKIDIEVDGGISPETIRLAFDAGANYFISGSYLIKSNNPKEAIKSMLKLLPSP